MGMTKTLYVAQTNVGEIYSESYPEPNEIAKQAWHHCRYYKKPPSIIKIYGIPKRIATDMRDVPRSRMVK